MCDFFSGRNNWHTPCFLGYSDVLQIQHLTLKWGSRLTVNILHIASELLLFALAGHSFPTPSQFRRKYQISDDLHAFNGAEDVQKNGLSLHQNKNYKRLVQSRWQCTVSPSRHHPVQKYILWFRQIRFSFSQIQFSKMKKDELSFLREAGGGALSAPWGTIRSLPCLCWHKLSSSQNISQEMHKIFLRLGKCIFLHQIALKKR